MYCQEPIRSWKANKKIRENKAINATLGTIAKKAEIGVGAPS
jgi:hypothetical protein